MLQKIIKMSIKASKVSNRNMNKSLSSMICSIYLFEGEKYFQFLILIGELCQVGHGGQKLDL